MNDVEGRATLRFARNQKSRNQKRKTRGSTLLLRE